MEPPSQYFAHYAAWLWPVLIGLIAIAILTLVAYFVFYPLIRRIHEALSSYSLRLSRRITEARVGRAESFANLIDEFCRNAGITVLRQADASLENVYRRFIEIANNITPSLQTVTDASKGFQRVTAPLLDACARPVPVLPAIPAADQLSAQHAVHRTAIVRLCVSSVILIALIGVNTGMLGQILRAFGFIPHDLAYAGIPLFLIFAFILTLAEAGLGYIHTATRPLPDEAERIAIWPVIAVAVAGIIACVEGFFYSQIAPDKEGLIALPGGYHVHQTSLFFLWGAALVLVLFGLGMIWSSSLERISQAASHYPSLVRRLVRYREKFATASEKADRAGMRFRERVDETVQALTAAAESTKQLVQDITKIRAMAPEKSEDMRPEELTRVDAYHFMYLSGIWLLAALVSFGIVSSLSGSAVRAVVPHLSGTVVILSGLAIALAFGVLGTLIPRGDLFLEGAGARRVVLSGSPWRDRAAFGMGILISLLFAAILWRSRASTYAVVVWLICYVVGAGNAAAVSQAAAMTKAVRLWLRRCADLLRSSVEFAWQVIVKTVLGIVMATEIITLAFAAPLFRLSGRELPSLDVQTLEPPARSLTVRTSA